MALLTGVALLEKEMAAQPPPAKRFDSAFLERLPATTVMFAAMPNLSSNLDESLTHVRERIASDPRLAVLAGQGYEPRRDGDRVDLHNCPFHALAGTGAGQDRLAAPARGEPGQRPR